MFSSILILFAFVKLSSSCHGISGVPSIPIPSGPTGLGKCLHWNGKVQLDSISNETKRVHELGIGDRVLAYDINRGFHTSPVVAILHRDLIHDRDFVEISTENGHQVSLTPEHGIYSGSCGVENWNEKRADSLNLGDCVKTAGNQEDRVIKIRPFIDSGIVQPITETGSIVVDDLVLSCYDYENEKKTNPHYVHEPHRQLYSFGEHIYTALHESKFAVNVLETLISALGLEKMYE